MMKPKPIAECIPSDLIEYHALVYGRCKIWHHDLPDATGAPRCVWSKWAWWKAMHYTHRGSPRNQCAWGIYAGHSGYTGPGDAQITHFLPMIEPPDGAPTGYEE